MHSAEHIAEVKAELDAFYRDHPDGVVVIWGATATGKTAMSVQLSDFFDMEVISSDSRQVFRGMDIGTDKIGQEVRDIVPHHQIDIVDPDGNYTAGEWRDETISLIDDIIARKKKPFVVGGTGLYIDMIYKNFIMPDVKADRETRALWEEEEKKQPGLLHQRLMEIDPEEAMKHPPENIRFIIRALEIYHKTGKTKTFYSAIRKPRWPLFMLGIWREKEETNKLINKRIKEMMKGGLIEETQGLLDAGYSRDLQSMNGIGYKETVGYLMDEYNKDKMEELLKRNTHRLAKKQRTWFRKYIAEGKMGREGIRYYTIYL